MSALSNQATSLDAAMASPFQIEDHWRGASELQSKIENQKSKIPESAFVILSDFNIRQFVIS
jgi:hypothetical protein